MSRAWTTQKLFRIGGTSKKAQVDIGPETFPPPSEDEIQQLIDKLEEATAALDQVIGYDATLRARFGDDFVNYIDQLSDGLHYVLLQGRRPGPPSEFSEREPSVEPGLEGPPGIPEEPIEFAPEAPAARPGPGPRPAPRPTPVGPTASLHASAQDSAAQLDDALTDLETKLADSFGPLLKQASLEGLDPDPIHRINDAADVAREALEEIRGALESE